MKIHFSEKHKIHQKEIANLIASFDDSGEAITPGIRNLIKKFDLAGQKINIKSFKVPNFVNQIAYKFFRKSKAERSFEYAQHLIANEIGTPYPIAYATNNSSLLFKDSYYVSEHLDYDLTYRELVTNPDYPDHEKILRAFTRFTFSLHEKDIEFLDHSPGNTLIQLNNGNYLFYLVDLNRMNFRKLSFEDRMKNFSRLTPKKSMVKIMANEYAKLTDEDEKIVFEDMWEFTKQFQHKFKRKKELKKKLKFWKD